MLPEHRGKKKKKEKGIRLVNNILICAPTIKVYLFAVKFIRL